MTQYNSANVKLSNSELNKLKPLTKNVRLSSNVIDNNKVLVDRQFFSFCKAFANKSFVNEKLIKT